MTLIDLFKPKKEYVKHGHWLRSKYGTYYCSRCLRTAPYEDDSWGHVISAPKFNYCPYCGAKMNRR